MQCLAKSSSQKGHAEIVKELLKSERVDPSEDCNRALRAACAFGHVGVVEVLLRDPRVDSRAMDNEALKVSLRRGFHGIAARLKEAQRIAIC